VSEQTRDELLLATFVAVRAILKAEIDRAEDEALIAMLRDTLSVGSALFDCACREAEA